MSCETVCRPMTQAEMDRASAEEESSYSQLEAAPIPGGGKPAGAATPEVTVGPYFEDLCDNYVSLFSPTSAKGFLQLPCDQLIDTPHCQQGYCQCSTMLSNERVAVNVCDGKKPFEKFTCNAKCDALASCRNGWKPDAPAGSAFSGPKGCEDSVSLVEFNSGGHCECEFDLTAPSSASVKVPSSAPADATTYVEFTCSDACREVLQLNGHVTTSKNAQPAAALPVLLETGSALRGRRAAAAPAAPSRADAAERMSLLEMRATLGRAICEAKAGVWDGEAAACDEFMRSTVAKTAYEPNGVFSSCQAEFGDSYVPCSPYQALALAHMYRVPDHKYYWLWPGGRAEQVKSAALKQEVGNNPASGLDKCAAGQHVGFFHNWDDAHVDSWGCLNDDAVLPVLCCRRQ